MNKVIELIAATTIVMTVLLVEHLALWQKVKPPWSYILGVSTLGVPLTALWLQWGDGWAVVSSWVLVGAGGFMVWLCYDVRINLENKSLKAEVVRALGFANELIMTLRKAEGGSNEEGERRTRSS